MEAAQAFAAANPYVPITHFQYGQVMEGRRKPRELGSEYAYSPVIDRHPLRVRLVHRDGGRVFLQRREDNSIFMAEDFAYYWPIIPLAEHGAAAGAAAAAAAGAGAAAAPARVEIRGNTGGTPNTMNALNSTGGTSGGRRSRKSRKARRGSRKSRRATR